MKGVNTMITVKKVEMFIEDNEIGRSYPWECLFVTDNEFVQFLDENCAVGNTITVKSIETIQVEPEVLNQIYR